MSNTDSLEFTGLPGDTFSLPDLEYGYRAFEPHLDAGTMFLHHQVHHRGYVDKLNQFIAGHPEIHGLSLFDLLTNHWKHEEVRKNGGGHYNHSLMWKMLTPNPKPPKEDLFFGYGNAEIFKDKVRRSAKKIFGSGWVWLAVDKRRTPQVYAMDRQDNPIMRGDVPVWGLDLWEHAYYKKYGPNRENYLEAVFEVTNWEALSRRFERAMLKI